MKRCLIALCLLVGAGCAARPAATTSTSAPPPLVRLLVHDQQGVALADQAAAQSSTPSIQALATQLAAFHQAESELVAARLDAAGIPPAERYVPGTARPAGRSIYHCEVATTDQVSQLAAASGDDFDGQFVRLMSRHLAGGRDLVLAALDGADRTQELAELAGLADSVSQRLVAEPL